MAFKRMEDINSKKYGHLFRIEEDGGSALGVFLYKSYSDVLQADCHYINTPDYTGYAHCLGSGCPACNKGLQLKRKVFIPILVIGDLNDNYDSDQVLLWDRNISFDTQLRQQVFKVSPNPSESIFEITRHGEPRDIHTYYEIEARYNFGNDVDEICANLGVSFPDYYDKICKDFDFATLSEMLKNAKSKNSYNKATTPAYSYEVKPRTIVDPSTITPAKVSNIDDEPVPFDEVGSDLDEVPNF